MPASTHTILRWGRLGLLAVGVAFSLAGSLATTSGALADDCTNVQACLKNDYVTAETATPPAPAPLTIKATKFETSEDQYSHTSQDAWCKIPVPLQGLSDTGTGGDIYPSEAQAHGQAGVGYQHYYDPGQDPFPCNTVVDEFYRGGVGFDMAKVNAFVKAHGLKQASLRYSLVSGYATCISTIDVTSATWRDVVNSPDVLTDGGWHLTPPPPGNGNFNIDVTGLIALESAGGSGAPNMHFVFVGLNEDLRAQDNNSCEALLGGFQLTLTPDH